MELPKYTLPILNATFEEAKIGINNQHFRFKPRTVTPIDYQYAPIIESEYKQFGLIPIKNKEELAEKEREALTAYLGHLEFRIACRRAAIDELKKTGKVIDEFNKDQVMLNKDLKWRHEIYSLLNKEMPSEEVYSFATDRKEILFNGTMETQVILPEIESSKSGSFAEIGLKAARRIKAIEDQLV